MEKAHPKTPNGHKKKSGKPCKIKVSRIKCKKNDFFLSAAEETAEKISLFLSQFGATPSIL